MRPTMLEKLYDDRRVNADDKLCMLAYKVWHKGECNQDCQNCGFYRMEDKCVLDLIELDCPVLQGGEFTILKLASMAGYKYLAADPDGEVYLYSEKPISPNGEWITPLSVPAAMKIEGRTGYDFHFVTHYDREPWLIKDLLEYTTEYRRKNKND